MKLVFKHRLCLSQDRKHKSPPLLFSAQYEAHSPAETAAPPSRRRLVQAQEMIRQAQNKSTVRSEGFYSMSELHWMKVEVPKKKEKMNVSGCNFFSLMFEDRCGKKFLDTLKM